MHSPLENLTGAGKPLAAEPADAREFERMRSAALARLNDARNPANSLEGRFDLAYNAARGLCLAALRWHGYRANHRYIVFQILPHTLGLGPEVWRVLSKCHDVRNVGEYEGDFDIDERLVGDLVTACEAVARKVMTLASPKMTKK
ncbi:MAG TPA: hypothetical protein VFE23_21640 [Usitatibacter sp.]|jgi:hypothetical protein|nr:hypothetical protein [Usitatibacter sp.]